MPCNCARGDVGPTVVSVITVKTGGGRSRRARGTSVRPRTPGCQIICRRDHDLGESHLPGRRRSACCANVSCAWIRAVRTAHIPSRSGQVGLALNVTFDRGTGPERSVNTTDAMRSANGCSAGATARGRFR
jgi:hypothetical protein